MNTPLIQINKRTGIVGAVMAAVVFAVCCIRYSWMDGIVFALMFLVAGFLKIRMERPAGKFLVNALWGVACVFFSCWISTRMVTDNSHFAVGYYRVIMNFLCAALVYGICLVITGRIRWAVVLASGLLLIFTTVNGFVFQFRGNELKPMDFFSVGTALNVVDQYVFQVRQGMAQGWIMWAWMVFCLWSLPGDDGIARKNRKWFRLAAAAACAVCFFAILYGARNVRVYTWSNEGTTRNGYFLNFAVGIRDCFVEAPEDYSPESIAELEQEYAAEAVQENLPNIIVIMNESYADFSILGNELHTNQPVTPFLDSLQENTIRGYALTSIFGGTTANSEFEFLTGHSMAFLPDGSVPYQQYINADTYSLARLLEAYGYTSMVTHPWIANGWNRPQVYPRFGFSESTFIESYPNQKLLREFVSDQEMYEYVLKTLDAQKDAPLFLFGITMQNHGDYIYTGENYEQTIFLEGYEGDYPMAEQYLTLLNESDKAVQYLLTELENYPEDTVVLFFGDHFPQVEGDFFLEVHGGEFESLSEQLLQYTIPFFIWANYDIPEQTVECTSLNYLARYLLEAAGLELPSYYRFLKELEENIPAVSALGYYSLSAQTYLPLTEAEGVEDQWLNRYEMLQYNSLFDSDRRSGVFFQQYIAPEANS